MFNPSTPVSSEAFFDREEALEHLVRTTESLRAGAPSWVAILGRRKVGKSSLLLELARRVTAADLSVVILDSDEFAPMGSDVLRRYALRVVEYVLGARLGCSLEQRQYRPVDYRAALVPILSAMPPDTARLVMDLPELESGPTTDRLLLDLPEKLAEALGVRIIVAWDEFQRVASIRGRGELVPAMRSAWQRHRRVAYVISGSERSVLRQMVLSEHSPFFQHFAIRELGSLPPRDAVRLLVECAPPEHPIPEALAGRAAQLLDGHPFYLQLFGDEITRLPPPCDERVLKEALQSLLFSRTGRLSLYFENEYQRAIGSATTLAATLAAVAQQPSTLSEVASLIGAPTSATSQYLGRLGDLVVRNDQRWEVADPVFAQWLRWRGPLGAAVPMRVLGDEGERLAAEHLASLGFDLIYQSRGSRGSFDLLAVRGAWPMGVQVRRRPLPLRFTTTEWTRMEADAARFGWRWAIVAVDPEDGTVRVLDPSRARGSRGRILDEEAKLDNVLAWVQRPG